MSGRQIVPSFFIGTPFVIKRKDELRKSSVLDSEGRSRFHGAFEGGFSAGYYNTVGSAEGWKPSQYVRGVSQSVEDFMDEEDDALLGDKVRTRSDFALTTGSQTISNAADLFSTTVPQELNWFGAVASNSSSSNGRTTPDQTAALASIGKKLFRLCLNKETRKQRYLNEAEELLAKKRAPLARGHFGLGYIPKDHEQNNSRMAEDAAAWLRKRTSNIDDVEEDDDRLVRNHQNLSFHVIDLEEDEDDLVTVRNSKAQSKERMKKMVDRLTNRSSMMDKELSLGRWADGIALPTGCVLAKHHDPNKLMIEKRNASTPIPENVPSHHEFERHSHATRINDAMKIQQMYEPTHRFDSLKNDARHLIEQRFTKSGNAVESSISNERSKEFKRRVSKWIPNPQTKRMFGVQDMAVAVVSSSSNIAKSHAGEEEQLGDSTATEMEEKRPSVEELRRVFEPKKNEDEFYSSEDSEREVDNNNIELKLPIITTGREEERRQIRSDSSSSSEGRSRSSKRQKKEKRKKSKSRKSKSKRHRRRSSSTSSSSSSESTSSSSMFLLELK